MHSFLVSVRQGVADTTDHQGAALGLPSVDGLNMWPLLSGSAQESPRRELPLGLTSMYVPPRPAPPVVQHVTLALPSHATRAAAATSTSLSSTAERVR